ncbi:hypothetical protein [Bacillus sp. FSL R9-9410]|uniref:hypothetical protein n=1 Tax=Bacillus sp. FSL R9-9410 TaxID=2921590 RepID=UPI0031010B7E
MARYLKVKRDTELHKAFSEYAADIELLEQNKGKMEGFLKCEVNENMSHSSYLSLRSVPEELESEFRKRPDRQGFRAVKVRSKLKKEWDKFIKEIGIEFRDIRQIIFKFNLSSAFGKPALSRYYKMNNDFYFEAEEQRYDDEKVHEDMEFISEIEFMEVRTAFLKESA